MSTYIAYVTTLTNIFYSNVLTKSH